MKNKARNDAKTRTPQRPIHLVWAGTHLALAFHQSTQKEKPGYDVTK